MSDCIPSSTTRDIVKEDRALAVSFQPANGGAAVRGQMNGNDQKRRLTVEELEALIDHSWEELEKDNARPAPKKKAKRAANSTTCTKRVADSTTGPKRVAGSTTGAKRVADSTTGAKRVADSAKGARHVPDSTTGIGRMTERPLSQIADSDSTDSSDIVVTVNRPTDPRDELFGVADSTYSPRKCAAPIVKRNEPKAIVRKTERVSSTKLYRTSSAFPGTMQVPPQCSDDAVPSFSTPFFRGTELVRADRVPKHGRQEEGGVGLQRSLPHHNVQGVKAHKGNLPPSGDDDEREEIGQKTNTEHVFGAKKRSME